MSTRADVLGDRYLPLPPRPHPFHFTIYCSLSLSLSLSVCVSVCLVLLVSVCERVICFHGCSVGRYDSHRSRRTALWIKVCNLSAQSDSTVVKYYH